MLFVFGAKCRNLRRLDHQFFLLLISVFGSGGGPLHQSEIVVQAELGSTGILLRGLVLFCSQIALFRPIQYLVCIFHLQFSFGLICKIIIYLN